MNIPEEVLYILLAVAFGLAFRFLSTAYDRYVSRIGKLICSLGELGLSTLAEMFLLAIFLNGTHMETAFLPAAFAILLGNLLTLARLLLRFFLGKKRNLTQRQKTELLDQ